MIVFPAIDIRHGQCVRLAQGQAHAETVFADDPVEVAYRWLEEGAEWLHVIDLDGAFEGSPQNLPVIQRIVEAVPIPVQVGGGIRTQQAIERMLESGVRRVILGTVALKDPDLLQIVCNRYGDQIVVSIDARNGMVATEGWLDVSEKPAIDFGREVSERGVQTIIYTDIQRDGMLTGPNVPAIRRFASAITAGVIVAGGIASVDDIRVLKQCEPDGVCGVITGKALYVGSLRLREAITVAR